MKAKFVNETINFQRKKDPKEALGIGEIDLFEEWQNKIFNDSYTPVETENNMHKWAKILKDYFIGKKVKGYMAQGNNDSCSSMMEMTTGSQIVGIDMDGGSMFNNYYSFAFITIEPGLYENSPKDYYLIAPGEVYYYVDMGEQAGKKMRIIR